VRDQTRCALAGLLVVSNQGHGVAVEAGCCLHLSASRVCRNDGAGVWVAGRAVLHSASLYLGENARPVRSAPAARPSRASASQLLPRTDRRGG